MDNRPSVRSPVVFLLRLSKVYGMCINCNIPLPVAQKYIKKYGLPPNAVMSDCELADIANPLIPGGGLLALVSGSSPEDAFEPGLDTYNFFTIHKYDWVLDGIAPTKYGEVRYGHIIPTRSDVPANSTPSHEMDRIRAALKTT
jgi:hypothetical protein